MNELSGFQRDLLFVVGSMDGSSGQQVKEELQRTQGREVGHGRLYANLDTLVEEGLVGKLQTDGRSNTYVATERGRRFLQQRFAWEHRYHTRSTG